MNRNAMLAAAVAALIVAISLANLGVQSITSQSILFRTLSAVFFLSTLFFAVLYHRHTLRGFAQRLEREQEHKSDQKIAAARATLDTILNNIELAILETDLDGKIISSNEFARKALGTEEGRLKIDNIYQFPAPIYEQEALREKYADLLKYNKPFEALRTIRSASGSLVQWATVNALLSDEFNKPRGFLLIGQDVTERQKLQAQLIHNERLRAIGEMAAGIAHELNNMLSPVYSYAQMLQNITEDENVVKRAATMEDQTIRAINIVKGLLTYARQSGDVFVKINQEELVDETLMLLKYQLQKARIHVLKDYDSVAEILGNKSKLQQVLVNIIVNAKHAMPNGGQLLVKTYQDEFNTYIDITDSGVGMDQEMLDSIFEPFFTTKKSKGTGLGLSICRDIVEEHKGTIKVTSQKDIGTTFTLILPLAEVPIKV